MANRRADREFAVSLPPRRYDLVGDILAAAVTSALSGTELTAAVEAAARGAGVEVGQEASEHPREADDRPPLEQLADALRPLGYEPRCAGDGDGGGDGSEEAMLLANCPYHALAQDHTQLVCGLNRHFVQGVADGLGRGGVTACLEPAEGRCCVVARLRRS